MCGGGGGGDSWGWNMAVTTQYLSPSVVVSLLYGQLPYKTLMLSIGSSRSFSTVLKFLFTHACSFEVALLTMFVAFTMFVGTQ